MLIKIFDTAFNLKRLSKVEVIGVLKDPYFLTKINKKMDPDEIRICSNYYIKCTMDNKKTFEIDTLNFNSTDTIYNGLNYLCKQNEKDLKAFIRKVLPKEPFSDEKLEIGYALDDVLFATIKPVENSDLYFVCVNFSDNGIILSDKMSFKKCLQYLQNLALISTYNEYELKDYYKKNPKKRVLK